LAHFKRFHRICRFSGQCRAGHQTVTNLGLEISPAIPIFGISVSFAAVQVNQNQGGHFMYRSLFSRDVFAEMDRLQQEMRQAFNLSPSIRGIARGGFPAMNIGHTPQSIEIYAFAPGIDPAAIEVNIERGVLTITGERKSDLPGSEEKTAVHIDERFAGRFRRVVTLPDDADSSAVDAKYRDGVLHISIKRREAAQPRRISIQ
jgi:HSP20 family protein